MKKIFSFKKTDEGFVHHDKEKFDKWTKNLKSGRYWMIIQDDRPKRSNDQNRYFHGVIIKMISEETGQPFEWTKYRLKELFFSIDKDGEFINSEEPRNDPRFYMVKNTSDCTTVELENRMSRIRMWASDFLNLYIPEPNE